MMQRTVAIALGSLVLFGAWQPVPAADAQAGQALSQSTCSACHGQNGVGIIPLYPNLAGQKAGYLASQLRAFRDGSRKNPIMSPMALHLTDAQIDDLSAYFESLGLGGAACPPKS